MKKIKDLKIREATIKDFKLVKDFQSRMVKEERGLRISLRSRKKEVRTYNDNEIKRILRSPNGCFVIAEANGLPVGCAYVRIEKVFGDWCVYKKRGYLGQLFVDRKYRRKGIGKKILDYRIKWLKSRRIKFIVLRAYVKNKKAIKLFRKRGFKDYTVEMKL